MVPRRHDGPLTVSRPSGITHRITGVDLNHAQHTTTLPITDVPHNEPAYHTLHHRLLHDGNGIPGVQEAPFAPSYRKRCGDHVPRTPNGTRFSCRRGARHRRASKKARSRAPKAVSCKRLLAGGAANFNLLDCAVFCPSEQLCNRQILVQFWPMQRTSTCTNFVCVALFRGCAMEEWKPDQWDTNDPSVQI